MWGNIEIVITERRRNYLVPEPNYHTTKFFTKNILAIEMKKRDTYKEAFIFKIFNSRIKENISVKVLV